MQGSLKELISVSRNRESGRLNNGSLITLAPPHRGTTEFFCPENVTSQENRVRALLLRDSSTFLQSTIKKKNMSQFYRIENTLYFVQNAFQKYPFLVDVVRKSHCFFFFFQEMSSTLFCFCEREVSQDSHRGTPVNTFSNCASKPCQSSHQCVHFNHFSKQLLIIYLLILMYL